MTIQSDIDLVLQQYGLASEVRSATQLKGTHKAFRIDVNGRSYALRQYNPFMTTDDLTAQTFLAIALSQEGLPTPSPLPAKDKRFFAEVNQRLWVLFPWCEGHPGDSQQFEHLVALVEAQGKWIRCVDRIKKTPHWNLILSAARRLRRRKDWAWIFPLDHLPRFIENTAKQKLSSCNLAGKKADDLKILLPGLYQASRELGKMLAAQSIDSLPRMISHGDLWTSNICISGSGTCILDLDCFSHEPRITDFARAAHWYHARNSVEENRLLISRFSNIAEVTEEEIRILPSLIYARDLYFLVGAALRFPFESEVAQEEIIRMIDNGLMRLKHWDEERQFIETSFLVGDIGKS
jgi:Ser/Thr protein kinase RdoA (MazF antagonist)